MGSIWRNSFDLMRLIAHERGVHAEDLFQFGSKIYDLNYEGRAYLGQFQHGSWKRTSFEFRQHIWSVGSGYVTDRVVLKYLGNPEQYKVK